MKNKYYYFSTHTINQSIPTRLEAGATYTTLDKYSRDALDMLVDKYPKGELNESPLDYCSKFIMIHNSELYELKKLKGASLKYFLVEYLGFHFQWGASTRSFGKNSDKRAEEIPEKELIKEMTDPSGSIKKLLDSSGGNLPAVKPFLPAIMVSLNTNTRNKSIMTFGHTGRFCFDFDGLKDSNEARYWMNKVWGGTANIKPYMAFISPRGKGFKVFCKVDTSNPDFIRDFGLEERAVVMKHHKVWYEGARKELETKFPKIKDKIDLSTNDPQRLTYLPFITDKSCNFKYTPSMQSGYSIIVDKERDYEQKELQKKISENSKAIEKIMREQGIASKIDAYHLLIKNKSGDFDLEYETEKFIKVIDFIENLSIKDDRVSNWVHENFNDYHTLHKLSWVLYGVFGDLAIDEIKRLVPPDSNKLDESHNDYRWAIRSKDDYDTEQLHSLNAGAFYKLVMELGEVKNFLSEEYGVSSRNISDFKLINDYYETYQQNVELFNNDDDQADLNEFLDSITDYVDKNKVKLPLIEELKTIPAEITLEKNEYLDKNVMHNLFQNTYADKRIFCLRSQCNTGKNSIAGHPDFKMKGRVILSEPFMAISNQIAKEGWDEQNRPHQIFVNSNIEETVNSFKKTDEETLKVNYEKTLRGITLPNSNELVVHCTYNQVLNLSYEDMATFDYIFIDEAHTLSDGINYRPEVISGLMHHVIEFIAKKRKCKTKIIFMSGTPNVETQVIQEIMELYNIKSLFQRIIVDKKYKRKPTIHLTHLDTDNPIERSDAVVSQIKKYLKQERKVCHILNYKDKMDEYIREIQLKLSSSVKIGLFYSKSEGECTQNILSGKFGDYDVVLVTTFFINGININKDSLTEEEIKQGKNSTQKYGLVVDLGNMYTKVNAMDAIQAINRFRNRQCHSTIFLPKIFKPNLKNTSRKFDFRNAGKVLLGINRYNHHLLTVDENVLPNEIKEDEPTETIHLLDKVRKNPMLVSYQDISASTIEEENKKNVVSKIAEKNRIYEDWFCSLDGYHFLAKDAGFTSVIRHYYIGNPLQEMTKDQIELENNLIRNFLDNELAVTYLDNQIDIDKRISVKASNQILDPLSTDIGNFHAKELINDKYIIEGDFHISHERAVNKLIKSHLNLCYLYGAAKAIEILRALINPEVTLLPSKTSSYLKNITRYINSCNCIQNDKYLKGINYIKSLDFLSTKNLGIVKEINATNISYTVTNIELGKSLKEMYAKQQYDLTMYKLNTSNSKEKEQLKEYYSKTELIKTMDLEELATQLDKIADYRPLKYTKSGNLKSLETIIIPRILRSSKLLSDMDIEIEEFSEPDMSITKDNLNELDKFYRKNAKNLKVLKRNLKPLLKSNNQEIKENYESIKCAFKQKDIQSLMSAIDSLLKNSLLSETSTIFNILLKLKNDLTNLDELLLTCFKTSEYMTYKDLTNLKYIPFVRQTFFCDEDFKLESLDAKFTSLLENIKEEDVFSSLKKNSKLFKNSRRQSNETKTSFVVLNKKEDIIYADFSLSNTCIFLCKYAFRNDGFSMKDGSTPLKVLNKGIYNSETFKRDYYANSSANKTVANYSINTYEVNVDDYVNYLKPVRIKTLPKSRGKVA